MESEAQIMLVLLSVFILLALMSALFGCVCGCRKTVPKNELMGLAGMVKLTNPDENVNFSTPPPIVHLNSVAATADHLVNQASEINKRPNSTVTTATRSLPDLPVESGRQQVSDNIEPLWEAAEPNTDTSSDLYATVEDNKAGRGNGPKRELPRDSTIESSYGSPSQTDNSMSPYATVKPEHPYDQVKQKEEHPYAQVRGSGKAGPSRASDIPLHQSASSSSVDGPEAHKSSESSLSSAVDIPAASAIAGGIPANHELPYMTPPLAPVGQQQHFSGDSQDSSKGYTSISVREPLSNILGHLPRRQDAQDSHYTAISDDSADDMYAAIEDPHQAVYTSGSETYAQIRPMVVVATVNPVPSRIESLQPPTYHQHSRQESSSSATSSNASPSSPKPEKRQANSPLPRPPDPGNPALDEMYAKVMKKRRSSHSISSADHDSTEVSGVFGYETVQRPHSPQSPTQSYPPTLSASGYETVAKTSDVVGGYESLEGEHDSLAPGYERVAGGRDDMEPNYEELRPHNGWDSTYATVNKRRKPAEPDYASLSRKDPGYEHVEDLDPNYESVCRDSDPNYESVQKLEPPYEKVDPSPSTYVPVYNQDRTEDVYSQVNKQHMPR